MQENLNLIASLLRSKEFFKMNIYEKWRCYYHHSHPLPALFSFFTLAGLKNIEIEEILLLYVGGKRSIFCSQKPLKRFVLMGWKNVYEREDAHYFVHFI